MRQIFLILVNILTFALCHYRNSAYVYMQSITPSLEIFKNYISKDVPNVEGGFFQQSPNKLVTYVGVGSNNIAQIKSYLLSNGDGSGAGSNIKSVIDINENILSQEVVFSRKVLNATTPAPDNQTFSYIPNLCKYNGMINMVGPYNLITTATNIYLDNSGSTSQLKIDLRRIYNTDFALNGDVNSMTMTFVVVGFN